MIHVRVREKHRIDRRKILDEHAWRPQPANQHEPARKDRVHEDVKTSDLQEKGRMANESNSQFPGSQHRLPRASVHWLKG